MSECPYGYLPIGYGKDRSKLIVTISSPVKPDV